MKELFRGAPCQKPKLVLLTIKKQQGPRNGWTRRLQRAPFCAWDDIIHSFGPLELLQSRGRRVEDMITTRLEADLSFNMRKTSLCCSGPLLYGDRLALNTARCLVPGCILTNERLLLAFGGQSTYGTVNSESKNKLLCENLKCANTTGSKFNQLSLVAELQLAFDYTNKWNSSPRLFLAPQTSLKAFTSRWWYSICYDGHSHLSQSSVRHKLNWAAVIRDFRGCRQQRQREAH